jgi:hypothetical protein
MNKHTPAPLSGSELLKRLLERKEEKNENGQFVVINNIKDFSGTTYIRYDAMVFELNQIIKENKLIAASPELLEALLLCQKLISKDFNDEEKYQVQYVIELAIKKATE